MRADENFDGAGLDDLAAIRSLMAESQSFLSGTWTYQFVWGLVGATGLTGTWSAARAGHFDWIPWIWIVALTFGWGYSLWSRLAGSEGGPVSNVASRAFGSIWIALGVTLTLLGAVALSPSTGGGAVIDPRLLPGLIALIFGAGYFSSGHLARLRWLQGVAIAWWAGGVALLLWRHPDALLVLAVMTVFLEIGPALLLRRGDVREGAGA